ncbi:MAG: cobalamin biosynthesis protein [Deltaproteobacteria bacterium]|nr:cobalamin biosynthesis protein [Deltaproteobacteria bacterium]
MIDLILGGNKSGKSDFGLELLAAGPKPWTMIATGKSRDLAFREQIQAHRQTRDPSILVREVGTELPEIVAELSGQTGSVLVDSLDFWIFAIQNRCLDHSARLARQAELIDALQGWHGGRLVLVSTEMGLGPLAFDGSVRAFARDLGQLNREIARVSTSVYLVLAGLAHKLK